MNMFIYICEGNAMRKKDDSLRDTLLRSAREIAGAKGAQAINIRALAQSAGVAAGTVYNYFSNKDDILLALTEEFWRETLAGLEHELTAPSFCGRVEELYFLLKRRVEASAGMLMRSLGNVEAAGLARMGAMQEELEAHLLRWMEQDSQVRDNVWTPAFSREAYVRFLLGNLTASLRTGVPDIGFLTELIRRTLY